MNTRLIHSIVQLVQTLSLEEQQFLVDQLIRQIALARTPSESDLNIISTQDSWDVFLSIGQEAKLGRLKDAAIHHDRYLYQQP